jgi:membrane-associated phospholipid phosphatase
MSSTTCIGLHRGSIAVQLRLEHEQGFVGWPFSSVRTTGVRTAFGKVMVSLDSMAMMMLAVLLGCWIGRRRDGEVERVRRRTLLRGSVTEEGVESINQFY